MAAQWSARAAVLRLDPDRGSQVQAGALERISASLLAEVSASCTEAFALPHEAIPFTMGPQTDMFGMLG